MARECCTHTEYADMREVQEDRNYLAHRMILLDWLLNVQTRWKISNEAFHTGARILDRYL